MSDLLIKRSAVLSDDKLYRYRLERDLGRSGKTAAVIMVNPSIADADIDDHTIRKLYGFAERFDIGRLVVGNLFAFRATDIGELAQAADPIGPKNDWHLVDIMASATMVIVAWGSSGKLPRSLRSRWRDVICLADMNGIRGFWCLGTAADGHPLHPLTLGYERPLINWKVPA
jgi:hypothetical protein